MLLTTPTYLGESGRLLTAHSSQSQVSLDTEVKISARMRVHYFLMVSLLISTLKILFCSFQLWFWCFGREQFLWYLGSQLHSCRFGGRLVLEGKMTPGELTSFLLYTIYIATALATLSGLYG